MSSRLTKNFRIELFRIWGQIQSIAELNLLDFETPTFRMYFDAQLVISKGFLIHLSFRILSHTTIKMELSYFVSAFFCFVLFLLRNKPLYL